MKFCLKTCSILDSVNLLNPFFLEGSLMVVWGTVWTMRCATSHHVCSLRVLSLPVCSTQIFRDCFSVSQTGIQRGGPTIDGCMRSWYLQTYLLFPPFPWTYSPVCSASHNGGSLYGVFGLHTPPAAPTMMFTEVAAYAAEPPKVVEFAAVSPEAMAPAEASPEVVACAAEPPEVAALASTPCTVVAPIN